MATPAEWLEGARPRTLFLAVAPVIAGTGVAAHDAQRSGRRALLALVVALALQVGVNYANDYSDGVRGTDGRAAWWRGVRRPLRLAVAGVPATAGGGRGRPRDGRHRPALTALAGLVSSRR